MCIVKEHRGETLSESQNQMQESEKPKDSHGLGRRPVFYGCFKESTRLREWEPDMRKWVLDLG